ncbi:MAG: phosphomannomutase/phosphoglucomutase [Deltaproteobacteria bacterium]|nr:phosphomannomutase/phosphoglucomutase [Deltaproteobacteria bacterium]
MNPNIFRAYDIRGVADRDLDDDLVHSLGRAIATTVHLRGLPPVLAVGRDARLSSPRIASALIAGLVQGGIHVRDVGVVATPMVYFAAFTLEVAGGVMVTGSHNPAGDNGLKITLDKASMHGDEVQALRRIIQDGAYLDQGVGSVSEVDIAHPYIDFCVGNVKLGPRKLKVVVDAGNGPTGPVSPVILRRLGCEVVELFTEPDGNFPNHHPDPTVEANLADLRAKVAETGADLGVAYDGDGDRIGVVDERGGILWGDKLMIVLSRALLREVPGAAIVAEVKCSQTLFDDIAKHGGRPVLSKVGHSLIKDRMKREGAQLAGEMSGHIFYKHRYFGYDDATYTTCRLLEIVSNDPRPLSQFLADVPATHATAELRLDCPDEIKFAVVEAVARKYKQSHQVIDIDGVRVLFGDGWGLVRASNTGPVLVMRCEAESPERCDAIEAELRAAVRAAERGLV